MPHPRTDDETRGLRLDDEGVDLLLQRLQAPLDPIELLAHGPVVAPVAAVAQEHHDERDEDERAAAQLDLVLDDLSHHPPPYGPRKPTRLPVFRRGVGFIGPRAA